MGGPGLRVGGRPGMRRATPMPAVDNTNPLISLRPFWSSRSARERRTLAAMVSAVAGLHVLGFVALLASVGPGFLPIGIGVTAYTLGLRRAFDADHIAAIDNTTRKLMAEGKRPSSVGFWFSQRHRSAATTTASFSPARQRTWTTCSRPIFPACSRPATSAPGRPNGAPPPSAKGRWPSTSSTRTSPASPPFKECGERRRLQPSGRDRRPRAAGLGRRLRGLPADRRRVAAAARPASHLRRSCNNSVPQGASPS